MRLLFGRLLAVTRRCKLLLVLLFFLLHISSKLVASADASKTSTTTRPTALDDDDDNDNAASLLVDKKQKARSSNENDNANEQVHGLVWQDLSIATTTTTSSTTTPEGDDHRGGTAGGRRRRRQHKHGRGRHILLHPFSGRVPAGHVCGILGPSGSGKSSFLSALAGLSSHSIEGEVYAYHGQKASTTTTTAANNDNYHEVTDTVYQPILSSQVAWLQQHDDFFSMLTVYETVRLAAFLELPHLTQTQRDDLVHEQLRQLGLAKVAHRPVGEPSTSSSSSSSSSLSANRISGGERRRLAVALELLTDKQLLLADEATSGLDANMSQKVMELIQTVARERQIPALCSIHQPRSSIYKLLDYVIILSAGGHVCYSGPRSECLPYFARIGYPCPAEFNPAEFLMDLVSVETADDQQRVDEIVIQFAQRDGKELHDGAVVLMAGEVPSSTPSSSLVADAAMTNPRPSFLSLFRAPLRVLRRFGALLRRSWRQNIRNYSIHIYRVVASVLNAVLLASIFPSVAPGKLPSASSVADRVALLSFGAINMCFIAFMKTITLLAEERPVVDREQTRNQYTSLEYLTAKILADLPMDSLFAAIFTTVLKRVSGLVISWEKVTAIFALLTTSGASLGLALGCWSPDAQTSKTASIPVLILLMVVGIINPSGVDPTKTPPLVVQWIKQLSPFAFAIEALCLGEYPGMQFYSSKGWFSILRNLPRMGGLALVKNGDQVIEALGLSRQTYANAMRHMAFLSASYLMVSYIGLAFRHWIPKLQRAASSKRNRQRRNKSTVASGKTSSESNPNVKAPIKWPVKM